MSRELFLGRLRTGLAGLPPETISDYVSDYAAHFDEGVAAGRSEAATAPAAARGTRSTVAD